MKMKKIKFDFGFDDEVTLTNATIKEVLEHTTVGEIVYTQYNEELFDELKNYMADEYKAAYEESKEEMVGYEVAIWRENNKLKFEW